MTRIGLAIVASFAATPALAHLSPSEHGSFVAGLTHPVFGPDHILAMIGVGLWAVSLGGAATRTLPLAFVGAMLTGYLAAAAGLPLTAVEPMILISVLCLGLVVALALRLPTNAASWVVALFGLFHGHAHGGEIGTANALVFGAGFVVSTTLLHFAGIAFGRGALRAGGLRALGAMTALGGLWIAAFS